MSAERRSGRASRAHAGWLALAATALACSSEDERPPLLANDRGVPQPIEGCEDHLYASCDITQPSCQERIFAIMRCAYGVGEGDASLPPVSLLTREQAFEVLSADAEAGQDFETTVRAREYIGSIEPGLVGSASESLELTLEGVVGLYLFSTREIIVIDDGEPMNGLAANTTLGHELVHALQDQVHDLSALWASTELTSDADLALASLVEGEASLYELQMLLAYEGASMNVVDFDALLDYGDDMSRELGSPGLTARLIFPYTYGTSFAAERWATGGREALSAAYGAPPADTLAVLSGTALDRAPVTTTPAALEGYELVEQDVLGAWLMATTLAELQRDPSLEPAALAADWRGDRLSVYRELEGDGVVVDWTLQLRDEAAAARIGAVYDGWQPPAGELALRVDGSTLHLAVSDAPSEATAWLERWDADAQ